MVRKGKSDKVVYRGTHSKASGYEVTRNGTPLNPRIDLRNFSFLGYYWGQPCGGTHQLAIALLADATASPSSAIKHYQAFAEAILEKLPQKIPWEMTREVIGAWWANEVSEKKNFSLHKREKPKNSAQDALGSKISSMINTLDQPKRTTPGKDMTQ